MKVKIKSLLLLGPDKNLPLLTQNNINKLFSYDGQNGYLKIGNLNEKIKPIDILKLKDNFEFNSSTNVHILAHAGASTFFQFSILLKYIISIY